MDFKTNPNTDIEIRFQILNKYNAQSVNRYVEMSVRDM